MSNSITYAVMYWLQPSAFSNLRPTETLLEYELEPMTFVGRLGDHGPLFFCHWLDRDGDDSIYLISPISQRDLDRFKRNEIDYVTALRRATCWLARFTPDAEAETGWKITKVAVGRYDNLPKSCLPKPGVCLTPKHKSITTDH